MSVDLSQFFDVFFDEAEEHLANLESQVLGLDLTAVDTDTQNEIFRAAHSIKGGAATFGFKDMADLTHNVETLLDDVRKGRRAMTTEMVDAILQTVDVLKAMAAAHRARAPLPDSAGRALTERLVAMVKQAPDTAPLHRSAPAASINQIYRIEALISGEHDWHDMLMRLADFPKARVVSYPLESGSSEPLIIEVDGLPADLDLVVDCLCFVLPRDSIRTGTSGAAAAQPVEDDTFGFFDPIVEALVSGETASSGDEDGFGFFGPIPTAPSQKPASGAADEGFGFFDAEPPLPQPTPAQPVANMVEAANSAEAPQHVAVAAPHREARAAESSSIRVGVEKVDQLLNLVGELVITQSMLAQCGSALDPVANERLLAGIVQLERNTRELQESVMSIRMLPISAVFSRFPRLVRDIAGRLAKKVELKLIGEHTELDKGFIEKLSDPLTHLVRNSLDHGIELPEVRAGRGKPETGTLTLRAFHRGGNIVIEVGDDGGGLNRERILAKGRERGLPVSDTMTDQEVWALIFEPGFSTAATITDVSGRGVGMDVVRRNIQAMGGRIDIESMLGIGTTMTLRLPLTLAILDGMSVAVGDETFIIPLAFITESLQPQALDVKGVAGHGRVLKVRGDYVPLIALYDAFNIVPKVTELHRGLCVLLEADGERVALFVDDLLGQHQVVIKNLESNYRKVPGVSGATIMGDGRVALILDVPSIISMARAQGHGSKPGEEREAA